MKLIKPPLDYIETIDPSIFLAGSIENGTADNWQNRIVKALENEKVTIYNPRRDDWDWTWVQSIDNPKFFEQVNWELTRLEQCNIIPMYFDPNTKSPISLLEFGMFAKTGKMIVCCPEGFWRKGNVDIVCNRYEVKTAQTLNDLVDYVIENIKG